MNNNKISLYQKIADAAVDGHLSDSFSLLSDAERNSVTWADGARDGMLLYHVGKESPDGDALALMEKAVRCASAGDFAGADQAFLELGENTWAIMAYDALQDFIVQNQEELNTQNIREYAVHAITDSTDRECVKFGLTILELFDVETDGELKHKIWLLGLCDEFTLFAIYNIFRWEDGIEELFQLAKEVKGWGRIHAVANLVPSNDQIRDWLLKEGIHNQVLPMYSALTCWRKSGAEKVLQGSPTREEYSGLRDIIRALVQGEKNLRNSWDEDSRGKILRFLELADGMEREPEDDQVFREILEFYEQEHTKDEAICARCRELLDRK